MNPALHTSGADQRLARALSLIGDDPTGRAEDVYDARARDAARFAADHVHGWKPEWWLNLCAIAPDGDWKKPLIGKSCRAPEVAAKQAEIAAWIATVNRGGRGIYFAPNPLSRAPASGKANNADVAAVVTLHIDADPDCAAAGSYDAARDALWSCVQQSLESGDLPRPTFAVDSGNGAGLFFTLPEPMGAAEGRAACRTMQRRARSVLTRAKVDATHDPARVMRLPFTRNWPSKGKIEKGYPSGERSPWSSLRESGGPPLTAAFVADLGARSGCDDAEPPDPASVPQEALRAPDAETLAALVQDMPNPDSVDRAQWVDVLRAIRAAATGLLPDDGEEIAREWSERWAGGAHDEAAFAKTWRSVAGPSLIGWRWLVERAEGFGSSMPERLRYAEAVRDFALVAPAAAGGMTADAAGRFPLLTMADRAARAATAREYILKGLMARGDLVLLVGPPGAGKSLLGPLIAHAVASGAPVLGRRVRRQRALYVPCEDEHGMVGRVRALDMERGGADDLLLLGGAPNLRNKQDARDMCAVIAANRIGLVVVDTLAAAFPGMQENESADMGAAIAALRSLTKPTGAAVLALHHPAKADPTMEPRGFSGLAGAADVVLKIMPPAAKETVRTVAIGKNRNGPGFGNVGGFTVREVPIGLDVDGDPVVSVIAEETATCPRAAPKLPKQAESARAALYAAMHGGGADLPRGDGFPAEQTRGVRVDAWRVECMRRGLSGSNDPAAQRKAFARARDTLRDRGLIGIRDGLAWLLP